MPIRSRAPRRIGVGWRGSVRPIEARIGLTETADARHVLQTLLEGPERTLAAGARIARAPRIGRRSGSRRRCNARNQCGKREGNDSHPRISWVWRSTRVQLGERRIVAWDRRPRLYVFAHFATAILSKCGTS